MNNFNCDRQVKDKAIEYFKSVGINKGFDFQLDNNNNNNKYARADIKFNYIKNNKSFPYEIEIKERTASTINSYPDIMFEEEKLDYLLEQNKKGIHTYFLNVFKNGEAILYTVDDKLKYQTGISHQYKYTEKKCDTKINIPKIFLKIEDGKRIKI
ncbi:MAG: hypothetical protein IJH39_04140 [Clostridia bacterium]|nr:hypothetical protein [Clostridia bacterium]